MALFLLPACVSILPSPSWSSSYSSSWKSLHCLTCSGIELSHVKHCRCESASGRLALPNSDHVTMLDRMKAPLASACARRRAATRAARATALSSPVRMPQASSSQAMPYRAHSVRLALLSSFTEEASGVGPQSNTGTESFGFPARTYSSMEAQRTNPKTRL